MTRSQVKKMPTRQFNKSDKKTFLKINTSEQEQKRSRTKVGKQHKYCVISKIKLEVVIETTQLKKDPNELG